MPDLTKPTDKILGLANAFAGIGTLSPPPTPKGRYVWARALPQIQHAAAIYYGEERKLIEEHGKRDDAGKLVVRDIVLPNGEKGQSYDLKDAPAFNAAKQSLLDEPVTLTGVRPITRAELGACPITVQQEAWLVAGGLLEDTEPQD